MPSARVFFLLGLTLFSWATVLSQEPRLVPPPEAPDAKARTETRTFKVPPDFLQIGQADPAPAKGPAAKVHGASRRILEGVGISFPPGAYAYLDPATSRLIVHNTKENVELAEAFVDSCGIHSPKILTHLLTVVEAPAPVMQEIEKTLAADPVRTRSLDAGPLLRHLLERQRQPGSGVHVLTDTLVNAKSGTRVITEATCRRSQPDVQVDEKGRSVVAISDAGENVDIDLNPENGTTSDPAINNAAAVTEGGQHLRLQLESTIGADGITQECGYVLEFYDSFPAASAAPVAKADAEDAAPLPSRGSPGIRLCGSLSHRGGTQLLGLMQAPARERAADRQWAVFLTTDLQYVLPGAEVTAKDPDAIPPIVDGLVMLDLRMPELLPRLGMPGLPPRRAGQSLLAWFESCGLLPAKGASITQQGDVLHVVQTPENIDALVGMLYEHVTHAPKVVTLTWHTVEAPAGLLRLLALHPRDTGDYRPFWQALESAVAQGQARFVNSTVVDTQSGMRTKFHAGQEQQFLTVFTTQGTGRPELEMAVQPAGLVLEVEPTVGADGSLIDITLAHELHTRAPRIQFAPVLLRAAAADAGGTPAASTDLPLPEASLIRTLSGLMANGGIRLLSLHRPPDGTHGDVLWATFLRVDATPVMPEPFDWNRPVKPADVDTDTATLRTRAYHAPYDVVGMARTRAGVQDLSAPFALPAMGADPFGAAPPAVPGDPFAPAPAPEPAPAKSTSPFEITFPPGSSCKFDAATHTLTVRSTPENLALIENLVSDAYASEPVMVTLTTRIFQGPAAKLREVAARCAGRSDHHAALEELTTAVQDGNSNNLLRLLATSRTSGKPGQHSHTEQGLPQSFLDTLAIDPGGLAVPGLATRNVGLTLDWNPDLSDSRSLASTILVAEFHTAPPTAHAHTVRGIPGGPIDLHLKDCHVVSLATSMPLPRGSTRMVALWKPCGRPEFEKEDVLQVMFVTCEIEHPE